ncbi:CMRF35-like molecule 1 [Xyrauchen texanus]|uniref:CMRF35-like molecule 1 n=1 Tax=Xyrauchen texanus TaxID=154827 RepID=UPI002242928B|nr:CMRF35-like molecule 1 [Xyrauchen texanus]
MKVLYILLLAELSFQLQCDKTMIQATIGSSFTIVCTYKSNQFSYSKKYWCSGHSRDTCEVLMHTDGFTHAGYRQRANIIDRFSKGLIVFIKDLQLDDTGNYWVGIDKIYADIMLRIQVTVTKALTSYDCIRSTTPPSTTIKTTEKFWSSARHQTLYINQTWKESYFPWLCLIVQCMTDAACLVCLIVKQYHSMSVYVLAAASLHTCSAAVAVAVYQI